MATLERDVPSAVDTGVVLHTPPSDTADPELTILVPSLNEELTIGAFVDWCNEGLAKAGIRGEILIVDSSSDRTAEIALERGARVLKTPRRGLGRAYIDAIPYIRGKWVVMGDADCTYDFREIEPFVQKFREGYEFVMGSRFKGEIEPKAMPALHRYFGTPVTTLILNTLHKSAFSDIHCGMRGVSTDALRRIDLQSQGWEYASEMILRSSQLGLRTSEVPIRFYRDREGRVSNVKRAGWSTPWKAGWDSLRLMFVYRADFFLLKPGLVLAVIGLIGSAALSFGPISLGDVQLTLHTQLLTFALLLIGLSSVYMGVLARMIYAREGEDLERWLRLFAYNRTVFASFGIGAIGVLIDAVFLVRYLTNDLAVRPEDETLSHLATTGLLLIVAAFLTFTATLLIHALAARRAPAQVVRATLGEQH